MDPDKRLRAATDEPWLAVYTNSRSEWMAASQLAYQGYETLWLHYRDTVRHARRVSDVVRSYFPRYLFARGSTYDINRTIGVSTVVYAGEEPLEVPLEVIEELRERGDRNGLVKLDPEEKKGRVRYYNGQKVRINEGPFIGFIGVVSLDTGKQVQVWLEMFKGRVDVGLSPEHVSPVLRSYP